MLRMRSPRCHSGDSRSWMIKSARFQCRTIVPIVSKACKKGQEQISNIRSFLILPKLTLIRPLSSCSGGDAFQNRLPGYLTKLNCLNGMSARRQHPLVNNNNTVVPKVSITSVSPKARKARKYKISNPDPAFLRYRTRTQTEHPNQTSASKVLKTMYGCLNAARLSSDVSMMW